MITLKPLDKTNWQKVANLQLTEEQKDNLPNNLHSIAELQFYPQTKAVVIYNNDDTAVGFATFGMPVEEKAPKIFRLMIDKDYQGKGYGKQAARVIIKDLLINADEVQVCYNPNSDFLKRFYSSLGFKEKGILPAERRASGKMLAVLLKKDFQE